MSKPLLCATSLSKMSRKERYFELFIGLESFNDAGFAGCVGTVGLLGKY